MLFDKYNREIFRKYKWYGYLNRKHTETKMIREIKIHLVKIQLFYLVILVLRLIVIRVIYQHQIID
jgi:hypothetical protein